MKLNRRTMLRGLGVGLAIPPLASLLERSAMPAARAQAMPFSRVLVYHFPNGVSAPDWTPAGTGTLPVGSVMPLAADSSPILGVLDERGLRNDVTLLSGLSNWEVGRDADGDGQYAGHEQCAPTLLTATPSIPTDLGAAGSLGISVDQAIAASWRGRGAVADSLSVAPRYHSFGADKLIHVLSYDASGRPVDPTMRPSDLFDRFFLSAVDPAAFDRIRQERVSVLDYLRDSIADAQSRASTSDRRVLDQYLETVASAERTVGSIDAGGCSIGASWRDDAEAMRGFNSGSAYGPTELLAWSDLMLDMVTSAMQCDLVPVVTFSLNHSGEQDWNWPEHGGLSDHTVSHLSTDAADYKYGAAPPVARLVATSRWKLNRFCDLLDRMKARLLPDGRTLLDDTAVVCFSEYSSGPLHTSLDLPVLVAGGALTGAQRIRYTCAAPPHQWADPDYLDNRDRCSGTSFTPLANLWMTLARAAGLDSGALPALGNSTGTLENLW